VLEVCGEGSRVWLGGVVAVFEGGDQCLRAWMRYGKCDFWGARRLGIELSGSSDSSIIIIHRIFINSLDQE